LFGRKTKLQSSQPNLEIALKTVFMRIVCLVFGFLTAAWFVTPTAIAQTTSLTDAQAKSDVRLAKRALTELHPALTKYNSQAEMDAAFARFEARQPSSISPRPSSPPRFVAVTLGRIP
jgi:hypothetical protein